MLETLSIDLGFPDGRPAAALLIFRSCIHWRVFTLERTSFFERIVGAIGKQLTDNSDDPAKLAYWCVPCLLYVHVVCLKVADQHVL